MNKKVNKKLPHTIVRDGELYVILNYKTVSGSYKRLEKKLLNPTIEQITEDLKELKAALILKNNIETHGFTDEIESLSFREVAEKWLVGKSRVVREYTAKVYQRQLKNYLLDELGAVQFQKVNHLMLQKIVDRLYEKQHFRSIEAVKVLLSSIYRFALTQDLTNYSPLPKIIYPKRKIKESLSMTKEESRLFLEACQNEPYQLLFELQLLTGMRPEEILGLRWSDIDFENKILMIRQVFISRINKKIVFEKPKNARSKRSIPITSLLIEKLKEFKKNQNSEENIYNLVFPSKNYTPIKDTNLLRAMKRILKKNNLNENFSLYTLRHTTATLLLLMGENPKVVAERLGNSVEIVLSRYSHVTANLQESATEKLEKIFL